MATDRQTDRQTDRPTDKADYRDAGAYSSQHLKTGMDLEGTVYPRRLSFSQFVVLISNKKFFLQSRLNFWFPECG